MKIWKLIILIIVIIIGGIYGGNYIKTKMIGTETEKPSIKQVDDELQKIMDEENFKKATILRARQVASDNKREQETKRHEQVMAQIEAENEAIRQETLSLVGTNTSLK